MVNIDKNVPVFENGFYADAASQFEKFDSAFLKTWEEARMMEQALRMTYRQRKYGKIRRHSNQTVKRVTRLRRQKDSDGNVIGYRVWLMVDYPECTREVG
tara:strand:- start:205 stop:504 length:300 start_codon:yes stop_codon:yes gene_type:complete